MKLSSIEEKLLNRMKKYNGFILRFRWFLLAFWISITVVLNPRIFMLEVEMVIANSGLILYYWLKIEVFQRQN